MEGNRRIFETRSILNVERIRNFNRERLDIDTTVRRNGRNLNAYGAVIIRRRRHHQAEQVALGQSEGAITVVHTLAERRAFGNAAQNQRVDTLRSERIHRHINVERDGIALVTGAVADIENRVI